MSNLRNEVSLTLGGKEHTLRATFGAISGIEKALKMNLIPLIDRYAAGNFGVTEAAVIIFHGLKGFEDTRFGSIEEVGEAVMQTGLPELGEPIVKFLTMALNGVSLGKSQEPQ